MVDESRDGVLTGFQVYDPDSFVGGESKLAVFNFHHKGKPFFVRAAENKRERVIFALKVSLETVVNFV